MMVGWRVAEVKVGSLYAVATPHAGRDLLHF